MDIIVDAPGAAGDRNSWYIPYSGTGNRDGVRKYYASIYSDHTNTINGHALDMSYSNSTLWIVW